MDWNLGTAARTLAQEVRGEPAEGQKAVAWVLRNSLETRRWGHNLASVCLWKGRFSGWFQTKDPNFAYACGLQEDDPVLKHMADLMSAVLAAPAADDPTGRATHYYNPKAVPEPLWVKGDPSKGIPPATPCGQVGHHLFFRDVR